MRIPALLTLPLLLASACSNGGEESLADAGRRIYAGNCTACHNPNPALAGSLGPELAGASLALLEARVLRAEYPPGYAPKRDTQLMPAQPYLAKDIPALAAFLASIGE